jgi:hypothetical protein
MAKKPRPYVPSKRSSRVLGRPKETVEQVEVPADLQRIREMSPDEIAKLWRAHLDDEDVKLQ